MSVAKIEDVQWWIECHQDRIKTSKKNLALGFYEREEIAIESHYHGQGSSNAHIARCSAYLGDLDQAKSYFRLAAENTLKPFSMIYDPTDQDHHRIQPAWYLVVESVGIEGINYALCTGDIPLAKQAAALWQNPGDGDLMHAPINRYIHALTYCLLDRRVDAVPLLKTTLDWYQARKPSKKLTWQLNYYTLSLALYGIAKQDQTLLNDGLELQLEFHKRHARYGEIHDTPEALMSDHCVALTNLALLHGLKAEINDPLIPQGLLITV